MNNNYSDRPTLAALFITRMVFMALTVGLSSTTGGLFIRKLMAIKNESLSIGVTSSVVKVIDHTVVKKAFVFFRTLIKKCRSLACLRTF